MKNLEDIRKEIDSIDVQLTELFLQRMNLAKDASETKKESGLPVLDSARERKIINRVTANLDDEMAAYTQFLFTTLFDLSRSLQKQDLNCDSITAIEKSIKDANELFPQSAIVACQGTEGSNSQTACERLFARPNIMHFNNFEGVFTAVEKGLCSYGILPIENNLHGSVTAVYDLMKKHKFHIVRGIKLKIDHVLLAKNGTKLQDIKRIYSHEQALAQCSEFIKTLGDNVQTITCENTAIAAKMISESNETGIAAISSINCADLYNLQVISEKIQNDSNNYTRFICISKNPEIYPGSNKVSLMFAAPHKPGALYSILSKFSVMGINITKLESRPIPGKDFEFMFYIDIEATVCSKEVLNVIAQLDDCTFLGNYLEV